MSKYFTSSLFFTSVVSLSVFLFYALNQPIPSGYSYGAGLLLLSSLISLRYRPWQHLTRQDKSFVWLFLGVFCTGALTSMLHGNSSQDLDISSRFLFAIPVFFLLLKYPPRLSWLWAGVAVGGYTTAGVALWQLYGLGWTDVDGLSNGVRYGAISMMFGVLCMAGLLWVRRETVTHVRLWRTALGLSMLSACYGSLMSGTRGAWIALPIVFVLFCLGLFSRSNLRKAAAICVILLVAASTWIASTPTNPISTGYRNAVGDINDYFQRGIVTGSIGGRFAVWDAAFINIPQKPLLGWGIQEYHQQLKRQIAEGVLDPYVLELAHTHNMYLEALVYKGLTGLLAILALLIFPFWYFCQRLRSPRMTVRLLAISGTSLLAVFSILGLSHISLYRNDILLFFLVTMLTLWGCVRAEEQLIQTP